MLENQNYDANIYKTPKQQYLPYNPLVDYVIEDIISILEDTYLKDKTIDTYDIAYKLFEPEQYEEYDKNEPLVYFSSDSQAISWQKDYLPCFKEILDEIRNNYSDDYAEYLSNIFFENPDNFVYEIIVEVAFNVLRRCKTISDNWDGTITLNTETIKKIILELSNDDKHTKEFDD